MYRSVTLVGHFRVSRRYVNRGVVLRSGENCEHYTLRYRQANGKDKDFRIFNQDRSTRLTPLVLLRSNFELLFARLAQAERGLNFPTLDVGLPSEYRSTESLVPELDQAYVDPNSLDSPQLGINAVTKPCPRTGR